MKNNDIEVEIKPDGTPIFSRVVDKSEIKVPPKPKVNNKTEVKDKEKEKPKTTLEKIIDFYIRVSSTPKFRKNIPRTKPLLRVSNEALKKMIDKQKQEIRSKEIKDEVKEPKEEEKVEEDKAKQNSVKEEEDKDLELSPQIHDNLEKYFKELDTDKNRQLDKKEISESVEIKSELRRVRKLAEKLNKGYESEKEFYIEGNDIYFRGTIAILSKEMKENMQNKLITLRDTKAKVHKGLYNQYLKVKEKYGDEIEKYIENNKNLKIVGHSKGSILALYLANELLRRGRQDFELVLFGTPSIAGDELFQKLLKKQKINNIALHDDFVSKIRSKGYDIIPRNIILKKDSIKINDMRQRFYELTTLADILQNKKFQSEAFDYATKHSLTVYIKRLKNLL